MLPFRQRQADEGIVKQAGLHLFTVNQNRPAGLVGDAENQLPCAGNVDVAVYVGGAVGIHRHGLLAEDGNNFVHHIIIQTVGGYVQAAAVLGGQGNHIPRVMPAQVTDVVIFYLGKALVSSLGFHFQAVYTRIPHVGIIMAAHISCDGGRTVLFLEGAY